METERKLQSILKGKTKEQGTDAIPTNFDSNSTSVCFVLLMMMMGMKEPRRTI